MIVVSNPAAFQQQHKLLSASRCKYQTLSGSGYFTNTNIVSTLQLNHKLISANEYDYNSVSSVIFMRISVQAFAWRHGDLFELYFPEV